MADQLALGVIISMPGEPIQALQDVKELGIPTIQLLYPANLDTPEGIEKIKSAVEETGIEITAVFCGFPGEAYDDIPTVRETVGLVPESTRASRVATIDEISVFAQKLGVHRVAAHIGFVPEDHNDPIYPMMVETVQGICDRLKARDQVFALETGQETAAGLRRFIDDLKRDNIRVNFDPANMILYGNDDPIQALDLLINWIDGVHCKDGNWPTEEQKANELLGEETPLGQGAVNFPEWIKKLLSLGFTGPLTIEREISGEEQKRDILQGKELILENINKHRLC